MQRWRSRCGGGFASSACAWRSAPPQGRSSRPSCLVPRPSSGVLRPRWLVPAHNWLVRIIVALLLVPLAAQPGGATDRHRVARVYIYTAESPSGVVSDEEQGRRDSLRDLRDA